MLLLPLLSTAAGDAFAQVWHQERDNEVLNTRSGSSSPVSLQYNPTASWNAASAAWNGEKGGFHRPDRPAGKSELDLSVSELGAHGAFRSAGSIRYRNTRDLSRNWNSLIGNDPDNPYVICDTLADNSLTERFDIEGALSWAFAPGWTAAGKVGITTATLSDNKDPRPKNDISRIPFSLGVEHIFPDGWTAGIYAGAELFFSRFTNYLEYGQKAYRYYKMKGMGDFFAFSSSEISSAPREYAGTTYSAGANLSLDRKDFSNFTEFGFESGYENARDGGSAYEWKSGDYSFMQLRLLERIDFKGSLRQSITLTAGMKTTSGYWYDQKAMIDTEHGNLAYYEIKARYKNNASTRITAAAQYRIGMDKSWNAGVLAQFKSESATHYADGDPRIQSWNQLKLVADGWKSFYFGDHTLDISASAGYIMTLGEPRYATGNAGLPKDDITAVYVRPIFEYETASKALANLRADWVMPGTGKIGLRPGIFAGASVLASTKGQSYYGLSAGAFIKF